MSTPIVKRFLGTYACPLPGLPIKQVLCCHSRVLGGFAIKSSVMLYKYKLGLPWKV